MNWILKIFSWDDSILHVWYLTDKTEEEAYALSNTLCFGIFPDWELEHDGRRLA